MAKSTSNVNLITDTFQVLVTKVNDLLTALRGEIVTANSTLANTTGNTFLSGSFIANNIYVGNTISGGSIFSNTSSLPEIASAPLTFTCNVIFSSNTIVPGVTFTLANSIFSNSVFVNKTLTVNGAASFSNTLTVTGSCIFSNTLNVVGTLTRNGATVWDSSNFTANSFVQITGADFTGSILAPTVRISDNNYIASITSNVTKLQFDLLDSIQYDRVNNNLKFFIASNNVFTSNSTMFIANSALNVIGALTQNSFQVWHAGNFDPTGYANTVSAIFSANVNSPLYYVTSASNYSIGGNSTVDIITWDTGDTDQYDRVNNVRSFNIGSTQRFRLNSSGGNITGTLDVTSTISQNGAAVWHSGNFTPGSYALLTGATFTGAITVAGITTTADISRSSSGKYVYDAQVRSSAKITDGTAAPSGGSDGDIYFQYT